MTDEGRLRRPPLIEYKFDIKQIYGMGVAPHPLGQDRPGGWGAASLNICIYIYIYSAAIVTTLAQATPTETQDTQYNMMKPVLFTMALLLFGLLYYLWLLNGKSWCRMCGCIYEVIKRWLIKVKCVWLVLRAGPDDVSRNYRILLDYDAARELDEVLMYAGGDNVDEDAESETFLFVPDEGTWMEPRDERPDLHDVGGAQHEDNRRSVVTQTPQYTARYDIGDLLIVQSQQHVDIFGPTSLINRELRAMGAEHIRTGAHWQLHCPLDIYNLLAMMRRKFRRMPEPPTVVATILVNEPMRDGDIGWFGADGQMRGFNQHRF